jgi:ribosome biogenesis GTPase
MVRDACGLVPGGATAPPAQCEPTALARLGWDSFFAQQLDAQALNQTPPVRVVAVHRSGLQVAGEGIDQTIPTGPRPPQAIGCCSIPRAPGRAACWSARA